MTPHWTTVIAGWFRDCNTARPRSALGYLTPAVFAATVRRQQPAPGVNRCRLLPADPARACLTPRFQSPPDERRWQVSRGVLPNEAAIRGLVGAIPIEQDDASAVRRARSMTLKSVASASDDANVSLTHVAD